MPTDRAPIFGRDVADVAWRPGPEHLADSRLARFVRDTGMSDVAALHARAVDDPGWFWGAAADDLGLSWQRRPPAVMDTSRGLEGRRWGPGGGFNYARAAPGPRPARAPTGERGGGAG